MGIEQELVERLIGRTGRRGGRARWASASSPRQRPHSSAVSPQSRSWMPNPMPMSARVVSCFPPFSSQPTPGSSVGSARPGIHSPGSWAWDAGFTLLRAPPPDNQQMVALPSPFKGLSRLEDQVKPRSWDGGDKAGEAVLPPRSERLCAHQGKCFKAFSDGRNECCSHPSPDGIGDAYIGRSFSRKGAPFPNPPRTIRHPSVHSPGRTSCYQRAAATNIPSASPHPRGGGRSRFRIEARGRCPPAGEAIVAGDAGGAVMTRDPVQAAHRVSAAPGDV